MIRSLVVAALLVCAALFAQSARAANDYTDTWWTPLEPGWGVNLSQQANRVYVTFYLYGLDGKPVWYAALLERDGNGDRFTGTLSRFTGTYFGAPAWQGNTGTPVGTATFTATSSTTGTLAYSVDGVNASKSIERITLSPIGVAGIYIGGVSGRRSGCASSGAFVDPIQVDILHSTVTNSLRIDQISVTTGQVVCRMEGTTLQTGKLLAVDNASYTCLDGWNHPARIFNLRPTPGGFEAQWFSDGGNGCSESGQLSGVTQNP